jgi:hypothetical protein
MYACTHSEDYKNYILMRGRLREKRVRHKQKGKENKKTGREMYRGSHGHNTCMCKKCAC